MHQFIPIRLTHLKTALAISVTAILLGAPAHLQAVPGYSTSFDASDGFTSGGSLSGSPTTAPAAERWDTNDLDDLTTASDGSPKGQSDFVGIEGGYSIPASDFWAYLGGLARPVIPGADVIYLYRNFDISAATGGGNGNLLFTTQFSISSSNGTYPNRDSFAWSIRDSAANQLAALRFAPDTDPNKMAIFLDRAAGGTVNSGLAISYNSIYDLTLSISSTSQLSVSLKDGTGAISTIFNNQDVSGSAVATTDAVKQVAAEWILKNPASDLAGARTEAGSNALLFNNYSVVPEPSTVGLSLVAGLGGMIVMLRRRNKLS